MLFYRPLIVKPFLNSFWRFNSQLVSVTTQPFLPFVKAVVCGCFSLIDRNVHRQWASNSLLVNNKTFGASGYRVFFSSTHISGVLVLDR